MKADKASRCGVVLQEEGEVSREGSSMAGHHSTRP